MKTELIIDTTHIDSVSVKVVREDRVFEKTSSSRVKKAQAVLPLIEAILDEARIKKAELTDVTVLDGVESYTGVRVGFAIGNALGYLLGIPVNGKKALAMPTYKSIE
jgi:tRNA threonylcarbamoyladenosine biosynthesis protein TsaB